MKPSLSISISLTGAIVFHTALLASMASAQTTVPLSDPNVQTSSELLSTEPISIDNLSSATKNSVPSSNSTRLKSVADSIHREPLSTGEAAGIPSNLIPKDLFRTPSKPISDSHPLEPFQAPPPNPSFGINLNGL